MIIMIQKGKYNYLKKLKDNNISTLILTFQTTQFDFLKKKYTDKVSTLPPEFFLHSVNTFSHLGKVYDLNKTTKQKVTRYFEKIFKRE